MYIKFLRKKRGITQAEMAKDLNLNIKTFQNYENENVTIPKEKLVVLAEYLKVSVSYLFKDENEDEDENFIQKEIIDFDKEEIAIFINSNWEYMMESNLFNANFRAKAGEWVLKIKDKNINN